VAAGTRIHIEEVYPSGRRRHPVKRIVGEPFEVWADIFRDGHDKLRAVVNTDSGPSGETLCLSTMIVGGPLRLDVVGICQYTIEA
jgi:hypothetical protein